MTTAGHQEKITPEIHNSKPILREERTGATGGNPPPGYKAGRYIQEWHCAPPPMGKLFRVEHDEWTTDEETGLPLRKVYEVKML